MRRFFVALFVLSVISACTSSPPIISSNIGKVEFVNEIPVQRPLSIAVGREGRIYAGLQDGSISVFSTEGALISILPVAMNAKGRPLIRKPIDIAVSGERLYVLDQQSKQVVILSDDGSFVDSFGESGSSFGKFSSPSGISVRDGIIYVADSGNSRVQVFDKSGIFLHVIDGLLDKKDPLYDLARLRKPVDIGLDYRGNIYVVDGGDDTVKIFDRTGSFMGMLPELMEPVAVTVANDGLYVADGESFSVKKFDFKNHFDLTFGSKGKGRAQFSGIQALASASSGMVYVADNKRGLIHVFRAQQGDVVPNWKYSPPITTVRMQKEIAVTSIKAALRPDGELVVTNGRSIDLIRNGKAVEIVSRKSFKPVSVALAPDGSVWALDQRKKKVIKFDSSGKVLTSFGTSGRKAGMFKKPVDIAISSTGLIFVADAGNHMVHAFNADGVFLNALAEGARGVKLSRPVALDISPSNILYVLDSDLGSVFFYTTEGKALGSFGHNGSSETVFEDPVDVAATANEIFVLDEGGNSVKTFNTRGWLLRSFGCKGNDKGKLKDAEGLSVFGDTTLIISDTGNKRIQIWENIYTPAAPVDLVVDEGMRTLTLQWATDNVSTFVSGYRIRRAEAASGPYNPIAEVLKPPYSDHGLEPDKKYFYRVSALTGKGRESQLSKMIQGVPAKLTPKVPSGLRAIADEWSVTLVWDRSKDDFVDTYNIYRRDVGKIGQVAATDELTFVEGGLASNTHYEYLVTAVSTDRVESRGIAVEVDTKLATKPPLEIDLVEMKDIFSNTYKKYESDGVGSIRLTNNTGRDINKIKISFTIKEFMDFPSDLKIDSLSPGESRELVLKTVFNNNILNVTEDTPIQTEIVASYYDDSKLRQFNRSFPANVYEKHRMVWDTRKQFATFITPKDPVLLEFVRSVASQYPDGDFNVQRSAAVFGALGVLGLTYIPDPSNPYQITSNQTDFVDYIQYPQETLQRKSGDCDDLVALYCSALESLGMRTKVVEVPGHMLMMFATEIDAGGDPDTMDGLFVIHEDQLWVPVETTLVGSSFIKAWEKGSENYHQFDGKGLSLLDIHEAWADFKPASLQHGSWRPAFVDRKEIDARFNREFSTLKRTGLRLKTKKYRDRFNADNSDVDAVLQIGIIYGRAGEIFDAMKAFEKVLEIEPGHVAALINIGNVNYLNKEYEKSVAAYEKAVAIESDDALLWVNLARCYVKLGRKDKAQDAFSRARELDKEVVQKFRVLAMDLMSPI